MGIDYCVRALLLVGCLILAGSAPIVALGAQPSGAAVAAEQTLYSFCPQRGCIDGARPEAGLTMDGAGNLYGTALIGGNVNNAGVVFELVRTGSGWTQNILYSFCAQPRCPDGANPGAPLIMDSAGNLYGTTNLGGNSPDTGVVFELTPTSSGWTQKVLYSFCPQSGCTDGASPGAGLIMDGAGNLYGTTRYGGNANNSGVVFELTLGEGGWTQKVLYRFCSQDSCTDGHLPLAGLITDGAGNLYGTTYRGGGSLDAGVVFQLTPTGQGWTQKVVYSFCQQSGCADGANPAAGLIIDGAGNLYGTSAGGGSSGYGVVFALTPTGSGWTEKVLYNFCQQGGCADGANPVAGLILDGAGNLYGTTTGGGSSGYGVAFELTAAGSGSTETVLYSFCQQNGCADGAAPVAGLMMDGAGNLYGTTSHGGKGGSGVAFALGTPGTHTLSVGVTGSGSVTSSPAGIKCPSTCTASFNTGTQVTLTASPANGSIFQGWGGACSGTGTCSVTMNSDQSVTATFTSATYALSVSVVGSPGGSVTSSPSAIDCGSTCSANFAAGSQVTLTATAANGWGLSGWSGACSGIGGCSVTMNADTSISATFAPLFMSVEAPVVGLPTDIPGLPPPIIGPQ